MIGESWDLRASCLSPWLHACWVDCLTFMLHMPVDFLWPGKIFFSSFFFPTLFFYKIFCAFLVIVPLFFSACEYGREGKPEMAWKDLSPVLWFSLYSLINAHLLRVCCMWNVYGRLVFCCCTLLTCLFYHDSGWYLSILFYTCWRPLFLNNWLVHIEAHYIFLSFFHSPFQNLWHSFATADVKMWVLSWN